MSALDAVDDWLKSAPLAPAMRWIVAGLDVRFDQEFRDELASALQANELDELIDLHAYQWERNTNMDW